MEKHLILLASGLIASFATVCADAPKKDQQTKRVQPEHDSHSVYLFSPPCTFFVNFDALILQPSSSNLYYAAEADPLPAPTPNWKIHEVHPGYHFGFDIGVGGVFHSANSSLTLDWEHFHSLDSNRKTLPSSDMLGPFFEIGPDAGPYKKAQGHAFFRFNEVNLDYGIFVNFGNRLGTEIFAGVSFLKLRQILHTKFSSLDESVIRTIKTPSLFVGLGPQLGIDFSYRISKGFDLIGEGIASFYVGKMKNHTTYDSASAALIPLNIDPPNEQRTSVSNRSQVVPGFEGKLGLSYSYFFCKHYMIHLEAGYKAQIYLNAIQSTDMNSQVDLPPLPQATVGVYARTFQRNLSNFSLAGPYAAIELGF